jgi:hypothetical protein
MEVNERPREVCIYPHSTKAAPLIRSSHQACDLCYTRKLRCSGGQPRCSNCVTYAVDCTHKAQPRRSNTNARRKGGGSSKKADERQSLAAQTRQLGTENVRLLLSQDEYILVTYELNSLGWRWGGGHYQQIPLCF